MSIIARHNSVITHQRLLYIILLLAALQNLRHPIIVDDAYITLRAAQNFAQGKGLVFNPGENVLSTTAPGYAVILGVLTRLGFDTVWAAKFVSFLGLLLASICLVKITTVFGYPKAGFSAAFILCFFPDLVSTWGNECSLLLGLFLLAWLSFANDYPLGCATAIAFGCMVRPDFALPGILFACAWLLKSPRNFIKFAVVGIAISIAWILFMYHLFGTPIPHTLGVKKEQAEWIASGDPRAFAGWFSFARGFRWALRRIVFDKTAGIFIILGGLLLLRNKQLLIILLWAVLHLVAYYVINVPGNYSWYYYPLWLFMSLCAGIAIFSIQNYITTNTQTGKTYQWPKIALFLSLTFYCAMNLYGIARNQWNKDKYRSYSLMAELIQKHAKPHESVLMNEIGQMGYMSGRKVIDTHGLIHATEDREIFYNLSKLVEHFMPDFMVNEGWLNYAHPGYKQSVLAGTFEITLPLSDGRVVTYRQIDYCKVGTDHLPVLLKRLH